MSVSPFDMVAVGNAISESLAAQGFPRCKFIVIVLDDKGGKSIASNLVESNVCSTLLWEAAYVMEMADQQVDDDEIAGHA
jgi:hypothetical protein